VNYANNVYRNRGGVSSQSYYRTGGIATRTANYNRPTLSSTRPGGSVNPGPNGARPGTNNAGASTNNNYNRPGTNGTSTGRPSTGYNSSGGAQRSSLYSDRQGNVYQRPQQSSSWQQRTNRAWSPVNNTRPEVQNLNAQQMNRSRGEQRAQNFQRIPSSPSSGGFHSSGGGGSRPSSGGGGGSRSGGGGGGGSRSGGGHR
jgi:hypothetical protein